MPLTRSTDARRMPAITNHFLCVVRRVVRRVAHAFTVWAAIIAFRRLTITRAVSANFLVGSVDGHCFSFLRIRPVGEVVLTLKPSRYALR